MNNKMMLNVVLTSLSGSAPVSANSRHHCPRNSRHAAQVIDYAGGSCFRPSFEFVRARRRWLALPSGDTT